MHRLFIDQKLWSVRERFTVNDESGRPVYQVEGSLFQIPKQFTIRDVAGRERARVWKQPMSWLARFFVEVEGVQVATIRKELSFLRPRYSIEGPGLSVTGDFWNMSFELHRGASPIGRVDKKWMTVRDRYAVEVDNPDDELVVLGVVLAIDYVKRQEQAAASAG
ncbi:conserved hypothetical protein [Xylanimonas cellulosilytica DSM 15894]|uniref:LURP-one-related family protein n=1 Tax=Xylanimonas cellulosilytica (strain DSM 15894 / JCM 12276 / CECT 5975 / KCTC 9989 / LMG 20990 / NBRC 107835 / XIL07) TaxID=446471 RepID=D1BXA9_XYLCX|nr:LURP-one-related family protein [Xylanimonas cellulosilytica]ACZ29719.1 conserved hypothetical protein [Xylanimonas cellulosilytica DSM 15894]